MAAGDVVTVKVKGGTLDLKTPKHCRGLVPFVCEHGKAPRLVAWAHPAARMTEQSWVKGGCTREHRAAQVVE